MKPTERQKEAIQFISDCIASLETTNDINSPTHECSGVDDIVWSFEYEGYKDLELLKNAYLDILQFIRNNP